MTAVCYSRPLLTVPTNKLLRRGTCAKFHVYISKILVYRQTDGHGLIYSACHADNLDLYFRGFTTGCYKLRIKLNIPCSEYTPIIASKVFMDGSN